MIPYATSVPRRGFPWVVFALIAACTVVFLVQQSLDGRAYWQFIGQFALIPARYSQPYWALELGLNPENRLPFLTGVFLHGGWLHLIANMWSLWLFGPALEDRMGAGRFLLFYLIMGILASLAQYLAMPEARVPTIGASGAIAAVLGGYMRFFPRARVNFIFPIWLIPIFLSLPAWGYCGLWFALQLVQGTASLTGAAGGGVAWWAHIGGFAAGLGLVGLFAPPLPAGPWDQR